MAYPLGLPRHFAPLFRKAFVSFLLVFVSMIMPAQRVVLRERSFAEAASAGKIPDSQEVTVTVRLAIAPERTAGLKQRLRDQRDPSSAEYHKWLTPAEFASSFGQTEAEAAATVAWLESQGLTASVSRGRTTVTASGTAARIEAAFDVSLRQVRRGASTFYANVSGPSLPVEASSLIAAVHGLDTLPSAISFGGSGEPVSMLAAALDANASPVLSVTSTACWGEMPEAERESYRLLLQQANAQGSTVFSSSGCSDLSGGFPASLEEVTAVAPPSGSVGDSLADEVRPVWQDAPGLPEDHFRHIPDVVAEDMSGLAGAIRTISQRSGGRVGNVNATLYELAPMPGLYTQPDAAPSGTWETGTGLGLVDLEKLVKVFPRGTGGSFVSLNSSSYSPVHGQSITLTSNVSSGTGGATPTGTVTFATSAGTMLGSASLAGGTASFSTNALPGGTTAIVANYSGDASYAAAASPSASIFVQPEASALSAIVSSGAVIGGTYTVAVTDSAASGVGVPTGTVTVTLSGTTTSYTGTLVALGKNSSAVTVTIPATQVGTATLSINCSGDSTYSCNNPLTKTVTIGKASPTLVLAYTPNPPVSGASISFTASLAAVGNAPVPTGNVSFFDGTTTINAGKLSNGTVTVTGTDITTDTHSISATYDGDANYLSVTVTGATSTATPTSTTLSSSSTVANGMSIVFTASIAGTGTVAPTGPVSFFDGTALLATSAVASSMATFATASLDPNSNHSITAMYSGDSSNKASTSAAVIIQGKNASSSTVTGMLTATLAPASGAYNSVAVVSAVVALPAGATLPAGSMVSAQFTGLTGTYSAALVAGTGATAAATINVPVPVPGSYTVTAACAVTTAFTCSDGISLDLTATKGATLTTLTSSPSPAVAGASVMLTATVAPLPAATRLTVPASGLVTFYENGISIGMGTLDTTGVATLSAVAGSGATHLYTAVYAGDANYVTSKSTPAGLLTPAVLLTSSASSSLSGLNLVLTTRVMGVADASGAIVSPTGSVGFYDTASGAPVLLGTATLSGNASGTSVATLSTTGLMDGTHSIYALYGGDALYLTVMSAVVTVAVLDYNVGFSPATLTLKRGATGTVGLPVTLVGAFKGTITFACTPPAGTQTTCAISPSVLSGAGQTTLTISTTAPVTESAVVFGMRPLISAAALATLMFFGLPRRFRRPGFLLMLALIVGLAPGLGCGTGTTSGTQPMTNSGSPLGTTFFTITAAGSDGVNSVRHTYQFQVTITE